MQCPKCQQQLEEGTRFCPFDGTPLIDTASTVATPTPTARQRPPAKELELPVVVGNRYRLEELRGGGGMAKVYRAVDLTLDRNVAVKLINPELRAESEFDARFQREARIASQLGDPHIVVVHDYGFDAALGPYLVMEYLEGQSLREKLASSGPMPLKAVLQLAGGIYLALIHAHDKGIVHRDIKPDNIFLLNVSGVKLHVRVLDFGIARIYRGDDPANSNTITSAGSVLGTPRYMSPEQLAGQNVDARSDIYSAALVLYEALTGQLPYASGKRLCELCPEATPYLQDLLEQCLKPNPGERPPSAVEVYLRLQELGKASGILLLPPGAMDRIVAARKASTEETKVYVPEGRSRRWWLFGGAAALATLFVVGGVWWYATSPHPSSGPESLLAVRVEDDAAAARAKLKLDEIDQGNPWKLALGGALGHTLAPADLKLSAADLGQVKVLYNRARTTCLLLSREKVVAVVSADAGARTTRGVRVGSSANDMLGRYPDELHPAEQKLPDGQLITVYRQDALGIAFEMKGRTVTRITLYPPTTAANPPGHGD